MRKLKWLTKLTLALVLVLAFGLTGVACGPKTEDPGDPGKGTFSRISITNPPTKLNYVVGESFDPSGMEVTAHYTNPSGKSIVPADKYTYSPSGPLSPRETNITVSYKEDGITKTVSQEISIRLEGEYKAIIDNQYDFTEMVLVTRLEGENPSSSDGSNWEKNKSEANNVNYASGGRFLGNAGWANNWLQYDLVADEEITATVEIVVASSFWLSSGGHIRPMADLSRFIDITIFGCPVDIEKLNLYPGDGGVSCSYSNWTKLIIEDVTLIEGINPLVIRAKKVDDPSVPMADIWRIPSLDVINVWRQADDGEEDLLAETVNVYGVGEDRGDLKIVGLSTAMVGHNYFFEVRSNKTVSGKLNVSYSIDPFYSDVHIKKAYAHKISATESTVTPYDGPTLKESMESLPVLNGSRSYTQSGTMNNTYRVVLPASAIVGDIYIGAITIGDHEVLPYDMFNASSEKWVTAAGGNGNFNAKNLAQRGETMAVNNGGKAAYNLNKSGNSFHYSYLQYGNYWGSDVNSGLRFAVRQEKVYANEEDKVGEDKFVDNEYYSLCFNANNRIELRFGPSAAGIAAVAYFGEFTGATGDREWNRFDVVVDYVGTIAVIQVYVNYQKWHMTQFTAQTGVSYQNGNLIHVGGYKGGYASFFAVGAGIAFRPVYDFQYTGAVNNEFTGTETTKTSYEAENAVTNGTAIDSAGASGAKYVGSLAGADKYVKFTVAADAVKTATLDLVLACSYSSDTLDMINLNYYMVVLINGKAVDLSKVTLTNGAGSYTNWQHIIISGVTLDKGDNEVRILPVYAYAQNVFLLNNGNPSGSGWDYAMPNIDALHVYMPKISA